LISDIEGNHRLTQTIIAYCLLWSRVYWCEIFGDIIFDKNIPSDVFLVLPIRLRGFLDDRDWGTPGGDKG
jgi:hypothetical protein